MYINFLDIFNIFERGLLSEMEYRDIIICFRFSEMVMISVNYLSYGKWKVVGIEVEF